MKHARIALIVPCLLACAATARATTCTPTGFVRDSINLTAALVNPTGWVTGDIDATGCNIGVYYGAGARGVVYGANVHGANYFGIVNNGGNVDVLFSSISNIGENPLNGAQHGVGIYYAFGALNRGRIYGNTLWKYQKGGIAVNGTKDLIEIAFNHVVGEGPVSYIAQNGIQGGYGARVLVHDNFVSGNSYTGAGLTASGGIIFVGGDCYGGPAVTNSTANDNKIVGADIGVWFSNLDAGCLPMGTPTRDVAGQNDIINNLVTNTTGNGATQGYQAGIADQGDFDVIRGNNTCGVGYTGGISLTAALYPIDVTATNNPVVKNNTICQGPDPLLDGQPLLLQASPVQ